MDTIKELETYLECNGYSFSELSIGKHHAPEGIIIDENQGKYNYSYSERGKINILKSFNTEAELVKYALEDLMSDEWATAHIAAMTFDKSEIINAEEELKANGIYFKRNDMPNFRNGCPVYRIYVFGRDIFNLNAFKAKYLHTL